MPLLAILSWWKFGPNLWADKGFTLSWVTVFMLVLKSLKGFDLKKYTLTKRGGLWYNVSECVCSWWKLLIKCRSSFQPCYLCQTTDGDVIESRLEFHSWFMVLRWRILTLGVLLLLLRCRKLLNFYGFSKYASTSTWWMGILV